MRAEHKNGNCSSQNRNDQIVGTGVISDFGSKIVMDVTSNYQIIEKNNQIIEINNQIFRITIA